MYFYILVGCKKNRMTVSLLTYLVLFNFHSLTCFYFHSLVDKLHPDSFHLVEELKFGRLIYTVNKNVYRLKKYISVLAQKLVKAVVCISIDNSNFLFVYNFLLV